MSSEKKILDVCCGSRMFWFDKQHPNVVYSDIRSENYVLCDGRELIIKPDVVADFTNLPFEDESFYMVVFDPPHFNQLGKSSWMAKKYGVLLPTWETDIRGGFDECMRVLKPNGTLIFKWNEVKFPVKEILKLTDKKPLYGHKSGIKMQTHWICFIKE